MDLGIYAQGADDPDQYLDTRSTDAILNDITGGQHSLSTMHWFLLLLQFSGSVGSTLRVPRLGVEDRL